MKKQLRHNTKEVLVGMGCNKMKIISDKNITINDNLELFMMAKICNVELVDNDSIQRLMIKVKFKNEVEAFMMKDFELEYNGITYVAYNPTPSDTRQCKLALINKEFEKDFAEYERLVSCGWIPHLQEKQQEINIVKDVVSRLGLFRSSGWLIESIRVNKDTVLVVPEFIYKNVMKIRTFNKEKLAVGEDIKTEIVEETLKSSMNDGGGIIHPAMMEKVREGLGLNYTPCFIGVRSIYKCLKGGLVSIDFLKYFEDNYTEDTEWFEKRGNDFYVRDVYTSYDDKEKWIKITSETIIVPTTMTKWWELEKKGFNHYDEKYKSITQSLFVTKVSKEHTDKYKRTSYQLMSQLAFDNDILERLSRPTYNYLNNVLSLKEKEVKYFLGLVRRNVQELQEMSNEECLSEEHQIELEEDLKDLTEIGVSLEDKYGLLLSVDYDKFISLPWIRKTITRMAERKIKELVSGKFYTEADFKTLTQEPLGLLDFLIDRSKDSYGTLQVDEMWCNTNKDKALICRFPIASFSEVGIANFVKNEKYERYCGHWTDELLVFNAKDIRAKILSGCDFDMDNAGIFYNQDLMDSIVSPQDGIHFISTRAESAPANKVAYNKVNLLEANTKYMGNIIGSVALLGANVNNILQGLEYVNSDGDSVEYRDYWYKCTKDREDKALTAEEIAIWNNIISECIPAFYGNTDKARAIIKKKFYENQDTIYKIVEISMLAVDSAKRGENVDLNFINKTKKQYKKAYYMKYLPDKEVSKYSLTNYIASPMDRYVRYYCEASRESGSIFDGILTRVENYKKKMNFRNGDSFLELFKKADMINVDEDVIQKVAEEIWTSYKWYFNELGYIKNTNINKTELVEVWGIDEMGKPYGKEKEVLDEADNPIVDNEKVFLRNQRKNNLYITTEATVIEISKKYSNEEIIAGLYRLLIVKNNIGIQKYVFDFWFNWIEVIIYDKYKTAEVLEISSNLEDYEILFERVRVVKGTINEPLIGKVELEKFESKQYISFSESRFTISFRRESDVDLQDAEIRFLNDGEITVAYLQDIRLGEVFTNDVFKYGLTKVSPEAKFKVIDKGTDFTLKGEKKKSYKVLVEGL